MSTTTLTTLELGGHLAVLAKREGIGYLVEPRGDLVVAGESLTMIDHLAAIASLRDLGWVSDETEGLALGSERSVTGRRITALHACGPMRAYAARTIADHELDQATDDAHAAALTL